MSLVVPAPVATTVPPVPGPVPAVVVVVAVPAAVVALATGGERREHLSNSHCGSSLLTGGQMAPRCPPAPCIAAGPRAVSISWQLQGNFKERHCYSQSTFRKGEVSERCRCADDRPGSGLTIITSP